MLTKKHLYALLFLIISAFTFTSCEVEEVELGNIESFNILNIDKENITIDIAAKIKNPNNFSFTISKVDLDVTFNGFDLGKINKIEKVRIKKNSNEIQHLVFKLKLKDVMKGSMLFIPALLTNKAKIKINGYVKASKFPISRKIDIDYNSSTKISGLNNSGKS